MRKIIVICMLLIVILAGCTHNPATHKTTEMPPTVCELTDETQTDTLPVVKLPEESQSISVSESNKSTGETDAVVDMTEESHSTESTQSYTEETKTMGASETVQAEPTETTAPTSTESPQAETTEPVASTEPDGMEITDLPRLVQADSNEVAALVADYINQYRSSPATLLPGLGEVATYRANQLITNFSHADSASACTALHYGEFVDMTLYGCPESSNYYQGYNREAIAKGNWTGTADEIAQRIAIGFRNSTKHWAYVGSEEYCFMAVGVVYDPSNSTWYCCICMSSKNYGG